MYPSARAERYFESGRIAKAAQLWALELLSEQLGMDEQQVVRIYGLPALPAEPSSVVYLIGFRNAPPDGEPVKIGHTTSISRRIIELQPGSVRKLMLLTYIEGARELEQEIHGRLEPHRIREDWFRMCDDVRAEFAWTFENAEIAS